MKAITLKITAPKCGASSDELREALATALGASTEYVGARLSILPPDVKAVVAKAVKMVKQARLEYTIPWIGDEQVCTDDKAELAIEAIDLATEKAVAMIAEQAQAMSVWLPKVESALGAGASMVELPDPKEFTIKVTRAIGEASKSGKGLPRDATQAQVAEAMNKGAGYEALILHLTTLAEKISAGGKKGAAAALRLKEDAATAAKLGAVDKSMLANLNKLTAVLLSAGAGAKKVAAKAAVITAISDAATDAGDSTEDELLDEPLDEGEEVTAEDAEVIEEPSEQDDAIALI